MIQDASTKAPFTPDSVDHLSVCQLQLTRLVKQGEAIAGWFVYHHTLLNQRQYLRVLSHPLEPSQSALSENPEPEKFFHDLEQDAIEIQPGVWLFQHESSASFATGVYGLKFRDSLSSQWAYLILWGDRPATVLEPRLLLLEAETFQASIALDQQHYQQQQQTEHYQKVLKRIEHQLRNPLAVIHLYASNLHRSLAQENDRLQAVAIRDAVRHLSDHLTEMLAGCQRTQIKSEACEVRSLLTEVQQGLQLLVKNKQVDISWPTQPLRLMGDRAQLLQLFENLLHNALCFSPSQGNIAIHWQEFRREVLITVVDQGPGLSDTDMQQMFRPYYSKRPQGSGLGLAIAQQIVQEHGGKIWADNIPSGGAQFSIVLPKQSPKRVRIPSKINSQAHSCIRLPALAAHKDNR